MNFTVIIALLQSVLAFLAASVGTPSQAQAIAMAGQAMTIAQTAIIQSVSTSTAPQASIQQPAQPVQTPTFAPAITQPIVTPMQLTTPQIVAQIAQPIETIEIISPMANKGLAIQHLANPNMGKGAVRDELNNLIIAAIVRDASGAALRDKVVTVATTDPDQHQTINGTGDIVTTYVNGDKQQVPGYEFEYYIKTIGDHTITFSVDGIQQSVTITATADTRNL